jgi:hypothetical protein
LTDRVVTEPGYIDDGASVSIRDNDKEEVESLSTQEKLDGIVPEESSGKDIPDPEYLMDTESDLSTTSYQNLSDDDYLTDEERPATATQEFGDANNNGNF